MIKTTSYNQHEIIQDILKLHCPQGIEVDPTYSKGVFYKNAVIEQPIHKLDLYPQTPDTIKSDACSLPFKDGEIGSIMFDPPFVAGFTKKDKAPTGIIGERFHGFRYIPDLWEWYDKCLLEFERVLKKGGVLIFKCQDTVSQNKQWWSHIHVQNKAEECGFYMKDMFVLLAKHRITGHNHQNQVHARKYHSYFLVFTKK